MIIQSNIYNVALLLTIWLMTLASGPANAEDLKKIYIAEGVLARITEDGITGPFPEILYEAARQVGTEIEIIPIAWKRGPKRAQEESGAGAANVTRIPSRESLYVWIESYLPLTLTFYVMKDSELAPESIGDLEGLEVGVQLGSVSDAIVKDLKGHGMNITQFSRPELAPKMMKLGRVDGWLVWDIIGMGNFQEQLMVKDVRRTFSHNVGQVYLATNKSVSDTSVKKWRQAIANMKAEGIIQKILVRHYGSLVAKDIQWASEDPYASPPLSRPYTN